MTRAVFGSTNCVILIVLDAKLALLAVPDVTGEGRAQTLGAVPMMVNCVLAEILRLSRRAEKDCGRKNQQHQEI